MLGVVGGGVFEGGPAGGAGGGVQEQLGHPVAQGGAGVGADVHAGVLHGGVLVELLDHEARVAEVDGAGGQVGVSGGGAAQGGAGLGGEPVELLGGHERGQVEGLVGRPGGRDGGCARS
ncbi:hypothetical protein [Streptomyces sp. CS62]|uniref:hypothetical protein n=1 Tax=Streptomyces sp. CS62 TaxID=3119268 RepID=UPI002F945310